MHDNPFGMRLTLMIANKLCDSAVPMSLLGEHPNVHFHYYRPAIQKLKRKCTVAVYDMSIQGNEKVSSCFKAKLRAENGLSH